MYVCVCVHACVCACVCMHARVCTCVCVCGQIIKFIVIWHPLYLCFQWRELMQAKFVTTKTIQVLSCQVRVTVTSCFVYKVIRDLESIDHVCINPIRMIRLIHK